MSAPVTPTELRGAANQPYPHGSGFRVSANRAVLLRRAADALEAAENDWNELVAEMAVLSKRWDALNERAEAAERRVAELIRLCEAADGERDAALDTLAALQVEKP